ncbi:hypothetical protein VTK73DRAFT_3321 [Phialemonium thermophilum]|uniref:Uncharacterized protein n=1 Tax=Phialemonium thermophilum TaxID=223376 RepID=A0ABR3WZW3_9PEZI
MIPRGCICSDDRQHVRCGEMEDTSWGARRAGHGARFQAGCHWSKLTEKPWDGRVPQARPLFRRLKVTSTALKLLVPKGSAVTSVVGMGKRQGMHNLDLPSLAAAEYLTTDPTNVVGVSKFCQKTKVPLLCEELRNSSRLAKAIPSALPFMWLP